MGPQPVSSADHGTAREFGRPGGGSAVTPAPRGAAGAGGAAHRRGPVSPGPRSMAARGGALADSAPLFAALGDETRLGLVARLRGGGPRSIVRLTAGSAVTRQAVTKHVRVLAGAGLVWSERRGRERRWMLAPEQLEVARRYLDFMSQQWTSRLEALEAHLDLPDPDASGLPARAGRRLL
jgi:DNA-binding transcriptional ArsR family regulator